jgi:hypothetical protein
VRDPFGEQMLGLANVFREIAGSVDYGVPVAVLETGQVAGTVSNAFFDGVGVEIGIRSAARERGNPIAPRERALDDVPAQKVCAPENEDLHLSAIQLCVERLRCVDHKAAVMRVPAHRVARGGPARTPLAAALNGH